MQALRSGDIDLVATGAIYYILTEFPRWAGAKVVVALSRETPWLLIVRAEFVAKRGDLSAIKGLRLTAAGRVVATVRAIVKAQRMLRVDPSLARKIGERTFPPDSAELIVRTIQRDVGFL